MKIERWKPEGMYLQFAYVGNGVMLYTCNAINSNFPIGSTWVNLTSNSFGDAICDIVDIYVPEKCRRLGVATFMQGELLKMYGMLRTEIFTKLGRTALMRAGWKRNKQTGDYYLKGKVVKVAR